MYLLTCRVTQYSHLSNKGEVRLTDFEKKIHPPRAFPSSTFIDFLDLFHPPLLIYCIYVLNSFFLKNPPRLLILQLLHPLHVYQRDESTYVLHMFLSTLSVMMPTLNEVLYDYNPYFHACKFCIGCTANIMQRGFGVVQRVIII